jgi:hydrogenase maturation protease
MIPSILVAGIGNIFQGDDAFGVFAVQRFSADRLSQNVRVMDAGIRSLDLCFALLCDYELIILVDAASRGAEPGTLYTIEIQPHDIPDVCEDSMVNSHGLDPVRVLSLAKSMGAPLRKTYLVACEPLILNRDETGQIGLTDVVEAAVNPAVKTIERIINEFELSKSTVEKEEVLSRESS